MVNMAYAMVIFQSNKVQYIIYVQWKLHSAKHECIMTSHLMDTIT